MLKRNSNIFQQTHELNINFISLDYEPNPYQLNDILLYEY